MNYIERDAELIRQQIPDGTEIPVHSEVLFRAYAVLMRAKGANTRCEDVHDAWAAWISETDPDHEAARPFDQLDAETRSADAPFLQAIIQAARVKQQESQA